MKKYILISIILCFVFNAKAQMVSGNVGSNNNSSEIEVVKSDSSKSPFFINISYAKAGGEFTEPYTDGGYFSDPFNGISGLGGKGGFAMEMGNTFILDLPIIEEINIGIRYTWMDLAVMPFEYESTDILTFSSSTSFIPFVFLGQKLGPEIFIKPTKDFAIGVFYQINGAILLGGEANVYGYEFNLGGGAEDVNGDVYANSDVTFNLRHAIGLDINYKGLFAGIEFNGGRMKIEGNYTEDIYYYDNYGNYTNTFYTDYLQSEISLNQLRFKFGYMKTF